MSQQDDIPAAGREPQRVALELLEALIRARTPSGRYLGTLRTLAPTLNRKQASALAAQLRANQELAGTALLVPALEPSMAREQASWVARQAIATTRLPDDLDSFSLALVAEWLFGADLLLACETTVFASNASTLALRRHTSALRSLAGQMARQQMLDELDALPEVLIHPEDRVAVFAARAEAIPFSIVERDLPDLDLPPGPQMELLAQLSMLADTPRQPALATKAWLIWQAQHNRDQRLKVRTVLPTLQALTRLRPTMLPAIIDSVTAWALSLASARERARVAAALARLVPEEYRGRMLMAVLDMLEQRSPAGPALAGASAIWDLCPPDLAARAERLIERQTSQCRGPAHAVALLHGELDRFDVRSDTLPPFLGHLAQSAATGDTWGEAVARGIARLLPVVATSAGFGDALTCALTAASRCHGVVADQIRGASTRALVRSCADVPEVLDTLWKPIADPARRAAVAATIAAAAIAGPKRTAEAALLRPVERRWYTATAGARLWQHPRGQLVVGVVDEKSGEHVAAQLFLPSEPFDRLRHGVTLEGLPVRFIGVRTAEHEPQLVGIHQAAIAGLAPERGQITPELPIASSVVTLETTTENSTTAVREPVGFFPDGSLSLRGEYRFQMEHAARDDGYHGASTAPGDTRRVRVAREEFQALVERGGRTLRALSGSRATSGRPGISGHIAQYDLETFLSRQRLREDSQSIRAALEAEIAEGKISNEARSALFVELAELQMQQGAFAQAERTIRSALQRSGVIHPEWCARLIQLLAACLAEQGNPEEAEQLASLERSLRDAKVILPSGADGQHCWKLVVTAPAALDEKRSQSWQSALQRVVNVEVSYSVVEEQRHEVVVHNATRDEAMRLSRLVFASHIAVLLADPHTPIEQVEATRVEFGENHSFSSAA